MNTDKINGKTPEKIKEALCICTSKSACAFYLCPYIEAENCKDHLMRDALELIKRLEEAQPKWISVKDRLPESHDEKADCFLVTDGTFIWMAYYACKEWQFAECTDSPYVIDWTDITHWMPLPEPPKEEEK